MIPEKEAFDDGVIVAETREHQRRDVGSEGIRSRAARGFFGREFSKELKDEFHEGSIPNDDGGEEGFLRGFRTCSITD